MPIGYHLLFLFESFVYNQFIEGTRKLNSSVLMTLGVKRPKVKDNKTSSQGMPSPGVYEVETAARANKNTHAFSIFTSLIAKNRSVSMTTA